MEESQVVRERLARIDELGRSGAPGPAVLAELRGLVRDVEAPSSSPAGDGARAPGAGADRERPSAEGR